MADHDDDATPGTPSDEAEAGSAPDDTTEGEVLARDDEDDSDGDVAGDTAEGAAAVADEGPAEPKAADTVEGEVVGGDDGDGEGVEDTAEQEVVDDGGDADGVSTDDGGRRAGWVVPVLIGVAVVVAVVLGVVALAGGGDDDDPADDPAAAQDEDDGGGADTTVGTAVPTVTTAPGTPTAGLLSELEPVDSETWEPADDSVTIGGAAHAETVVSGPIGTCDEGAAQTVTYDLAGAYTWLEGIVGLVDGTETGLTVEIGFEADGEQVWWQTFAEGESTRVQLDVTDYRELTVTAAGLFPGTDAEEACVRAAYGDLTLR